MEEGGEGKKKRIQHTALFASTNDYFQWERMATRLPASRSSPRPAFPAPGGPQGRRAGGDGEGSAAFPHRQLPRLAGLGSDYP